MDIMDTIATREGGLDLTKSSTDDKRMYILSQKANYTIMKILFTGLTGRSITKIIIFFNPFMDPGVKLDRLVASAPLTPHGAGHPERLTPTFHLFFLMYTYCRAVIRNCCLMVKVTKY